MTLPSALEAVVWDFNGTLIDDLDLVIRSVNVQLGKRELPPLTLETYREVFGFPVKDYYRRIGRNPRARSTPQEKGSLQRSVQMKHTLDQRLFGARTDRLRVRPFPQQKVHRAEDQRFSRTRRPGEHVKPPVEGQGHILDHGQILDPKCF